MLNKGLQNGIISSYEDISTYTARTKCTSLNHIPYFDGDIWTLIIEYIINEKGNQEERQIVKRIQSAMTKQKKIYLVVNIECDEYLISVITLMKAHT